VAHRILAAGAQALTRRTIEVVEYALLLDGVGRSFEARVAPCGTAEFLLFVRDFTERARQDAELRRLARRLEERLAELERDFTHTVVAAASSFLALVDEEGALLGINRSLQEASGYGEAEVLGKPFWHYFLAGHKADAAREAFAGVVRGNRPAPREVEHRTRDGRRLVVEWTATPVLDHELKRRVILCGLDLTEHKRHEEELRRSRVRIVEAGDAERRRLERNLHDGAQQHLVIVSQYLHLAMAQLHDRPDGAEELLLTALEELGHAHEALRELARGLHPVLLTERGLAAAVTALAARVPVPVDVESRLDGDRLPPSVETAAYYVVAESLTNIVKYADAARAVVRIHLEPQAAVIGVVDDGAGGADPDGGSGLRGLIDRVEALGGTLALHSPPGQGTVVRAELPV
jgi:PAS domain S-box-containing protein